MPGPTIINRPPAFRTEDVRVTDEGAHVKFTVGNSTLTMHYEDALRISQMIRVHAKRAKKRAGDVSRHWSAVGVLEGIKG